jgi:hypothetical protein
MYTPEVTEVSVEVELFGDNGVTRGLLQIETGWGNEITGGEEVGQFVSDVKVYLVEYSEKVFAWRGRGSDRRWSVLSCGRRADPDLPRTVIKVPSPLSPHVLVDLSTDGGETLVESLLDDHAI